MNQSITQTITVTTGPAPSLASTGENAPALASIGAVLLILAVVLALLLRRGRPYARRVRSLLSIVGVVGVTGATIASTVHFASATASFTLTPQNKTISVAQGQSTTIPTVATLHTTSTAGYTLTLVQAQSVNGLSVTVKGGDVATDTSVATTPTILKASTAAAAVGGDIINGTLTVTAAANATPGTGDLKLTYLLTETPVPVPTTMSNLTKSYCTNSMTVYDGTNSSAILTLHDPRGAGQDYRVAKLADGNCWMLDSLKLGSTTGTITLTPSDTNIASNFILPQLSTKTTTDFSTNPGNDYDTPYAYGPIPGDTGSGDTSYGYLYNWSAATAGETRTSMPGDGTNGDIAPYNICAAGWRLPTAGASNSGLGEFADLDRAFGGTGMDALSGVNIAKWQSTGPFKGTLAGRWSTGFSLQGTRGFIWSSSARVGVAAGAYRASFYSNQILPGGTANRLDAMNIRCILQ